MVREIDNVFLPKTGVLCTVYEIFSRNKDEASSTLLRTLPHYKEGLQAYRCTDRGESEVDGLTLSVLAVGQSAG